MSRAEPSGWDELHQHSRYRPAYPSEPVVRFISRRYGGINAATEESARCLDLGCGAGRHLMTLERAGHRAVGVDYSRQGLEHARAQLEHVGFSSRVCIGEMTSLPFRTASFDAVIAYGVINYNTAAGMQQTVDEIERVLSPGGSLLVVTRTTDDFRHGRGDMVEPGTYVLDTDATNELGMLMRFLDRAEVDQLFRRFSQITVDRIDHSAGGGAIMNSDWVIEADR